jgi:hypothetical protein
MRTSTFDIAAQSTDTLAQVLFTFAMEQRLPFAVRNACPPGLCDCALEALLGELRAELEAGAASPALDGARRVLRLSPLEEKKLVARIETIASHAELARIVALLDAQLGVALHVAPGPNEVRTVRGLVVRLSCGEDNRGLCRKTRQAVAAAVRRCLEQRPEIVYAILDAHDLFGQP